ncbi:MAG: winged helix-turn-helix domain-containing protein [Acidobacteria bacterium]|nr:winged helix-turn-helix domain-containing protein [Acidobacteriota bacterium]
MSSSSASSLQASCSRARFALTQEGIAKCISASRETVTPVLSDFRRRRIVDVRGAILTVIDRGAPESCSDVYHDS